MTGTDLVKFLHVLSAITWVGAAIMVFILGSRAAATKDPAERARHSQSAAWLGQRFFMPVSIATLVFGILTVVVGPWGFDETWIILGIVGYAITTVTGAAFLGPQNEKIVELADERGPADPLVEQRINRVLLVSRIDLVVILAVVFDMVVKPGS